MADIVGERAFGINSIVKAEETIKITSIKYEVVWVDMKIIVPIHGLTYFWSYEEFKRNFIWCVKNNDACDNNVTGKHITSVKMEKRGIQ